MSRWMFSYRSTGFRSLTDRELQEIGSQYRRARWATTLVALGTVLMGAACLIGIGLATERPSVGVPIFIGVVIAFLWVFSRVSVFEGRHLLYRRAIRVREVEIFERSAVPDRVRILLGKALEQPAEDDGDSVDQLTGEDSVSSSRYWYREEQWFSHLIKQNGSLPSTFETVGRDGVVLLIDGKIMKRPVEASIVTVDDTAS